jgi:hypothetical protein
MQSTIHVTPTDYDVDAHAPASTYYTTGSNSSGALNRLKTYTVSIHHGTIFVSTCHCFATYTNLGLSEEPAQKHSQPNRYLVDEELHMVSTLRYI